MASKQQRPGPAPALMPTILVALLLALVVLLAPATGTWQMDTRGTAPTAPDSEEVEPEDPPPTIFENPGDDEVFATPITYEPFEFSPIWGQVILGTVALATVVISAILIWLFIRYRRGLPPDAARDDLHIDTEVNPEAQIPVMSRAASRAREELRAATEPGDAIIKAWLILEDAAASAGMRRLPADTPTDLTMKVLNRTQADPAATRGLLSLYHRARFGTSPMSATDQEQAVGHLEALSRSWDQVRL